MRGEERSWNDRQGEATQIFAIPPCSEDGGKSDDADPGPDPPPRSDDSGNSDDADPGPDPPPRSDGGSDSDERHRPRAQYWADLYKLMMM